MLTIDFINVGYGDAILIREQTERLFVMLVDCGDVTVGTKDLFSKRICAADFLEREGIDTIDLLVLTHLHLDHAGGLQKLIPRVRVREFWTNYLPQESSWGNQTAIPQGISAGAKCLLHSMNLLSAALVQMRQQGTHIRCVTQTQPPCVLGEELGVEAFCEDAVFYQKQADIWSAVAAKRAIGAQLDALDQFINNTSIRLRVSYHGKTVELPGDVYADCWEKQQVSSCDIVKLPHHGHSDALTEHLMAMLQADTAVISVSNTRRDDCPSKAILDLLKKYQVKIFVTDAVQYAEFDPQYHESVRFLIDVDGQIREYPSNVP